MLLAHVFNPASFQGAVFYAVSIILAAGIVGKVIHVVVSRYVARTAQRGVDSTSVQFLAQLARAVVYVLAFLLYTHLIPALQSLSTAWLASVGVASVVIGLAAQSTLGNLIAGVSLILYRPFRIGDRIQVILPTGTTEIGMVEAVDLGYTTLHTSDGRRLVLSNSVIANQTSINFSHTVGHVPCDVTVMVAAGSDLQQARTVLSDIAKGMPKVSNVNGCFVTGVTAQGATLTLSMACLDPGDVLQIKSDVLEAASQAFDTRKIQMV